MKQLLIAGVLGAIIGGGVAYYSLPEKVKIVEKKVVQTDVVTKVVKVIEKDGTVKETTEITDKSREVSDKFSETIKERKDWIATGGTSYRWDGSREYFGGLSRRVIGDVYVGVFASNSGAGVGISLRF